jgi:nucleotide-binding universal stress UspA family protein
VKNVLLVLSTSGTAERWIEMAVERALKDGLGLVALYILDKDLADEAFDTFTDIGFIGDKPSSELSESLMREYRQRGYEELGAVQMKAMEAGVPFDTLMEEGSFVAKILEVIERMEVAVAVVVSRRERSLLKYFSRSLAQEVSDRAECEVVVVPE